MKILVACEESQAVTIELRRLGHEAYSCDIIPCSGGHPEWHLQVDALELLKMKWDTVIIRGVETDADILAMQARLQKLNDEYDRLYGRALIEIEDITDPEVRVAISRRSFDGWSWAEVAQELGAIRDAEAVRKSVYDYFKKNQS